jgi:hypothetical protein
MKLWWGDEEMGDNLKLVYSQTQVADDNCRDWPYDIWIIMQTFRS